MRAFQWILGATAVFGLALGISFGGGVLYGRTTAPDNPTPAGSANAFAGGTGGSTVTGGGSGSGGGAQIRGGTQGVVEKVEGNSITLRTAQGTQTVTLAPDTEVRQTVTAQAADLKSGVTITVTGSTGADGAVQARTITITPATADGTAGAAGGTGTGGGGGGRRPSASATPAASTTPAR